MIPYLPTNLTVFMCIFPMGNEKAKKKRRNFSFLVNVERWHWMSVRLLNHIGIVNVFDLSAVHNAFARIIKSMEEKWLKTFSFSFQFSSSSSYSSIEKRTKVEQKRCKYIVKFAIVEKKTATTIDRDWFRESHDKTT